MRRSWVLWGAIAVMGIAGLADTLHAVDFKWGPYARLRHEYWKNVFDMRDSNPDDRNFYRFKLSLWGSADFDKDLGAYLRLTNESKAYIYYAGGDATYNINETVFDNLYVDGKNILGYPVSARLGRQDFLGIYGEGFLIMDGTPLDGSRTYYFNAAKVSWKAAEKNTLDFLYIGDTKYDDLLPIINEVKPRQILNYSDETAYALYHKDDAIPDLHWENYYIWKHENAGGAAAKMQALETTLNTFGSFARYNLGTTPYSVRGQLAYQFGTYGPNDRAGLGGYAFVEGSYKKAFWSPQVSAGYVYLSGDDPATAKNEAWDPLFSRWPWMSELYVLSYNAESGMGYWTNLLMPRFSVALLPNARTKLSLWYSTLSAEYPVGPSAVFGTGKDRGQLYQGRVDYAFTKNITTYAIIEYFQPGNFYAANPSDALFTRVEVQFKY